MVEDAAGDLFISNGQGIARIDAASIAVGSATPRIAMLAVALPVALTGAPRLSASTGPNGTDPRPFYVMAHNPNTLAMAELAL